MKRVGHSIRLEDQMHIHILVLFIIFFLSYQSFADVISLGDSKEEVIQQLGEPQGSMITPRMETLFYERGLVSATVLLDHRQQHWLRQRPD